MKDRLIQVFTGPIPIRQLSAKRRLRRSSRLGSRPHQRLLSRQSLAWRGAASVDAGRAARLPRRLARLAAWRALAVPLPQPLSGGRRSDLSASAAQAAAIIMCAMMSARTCLWRSPTGVTASLIVGNP